MTEEKGKTMLQFTQATAPHSAMHLFEQTADARQVALIARELSDGARRTLATLIVLCPGPFDSTGISKFSGNQKVARAYIETELGRAGLIGKRVTQERLGLYPTPLARAVHALLCASRVPSMS